MYKSPIEIIYGDIQKQIDNDIYRVTQKYEIKVDKNELIQALQYDRDQYEKGYADGKRDAMDELVRCKDCKHWHEETSWCTKHSHFVGFDGMACHPSQSSEWKMFEADDFCSYGERREGE